MVELICYDISFTSVRSCWSSWFFALFLLGISGCSPASNAAPAVSAAEPIPSSRSGIGSNGDAPDAELNADESVIHAGLARHVKRLAADIGERNADQAWGLADATDYIAAELEEMGYAVERQGYEVGAALVQNLSVGVAGGARGDERFLVGTHFDSAPGSRGLESALATALVLELARMMRGARLERGLVLALWGLGEGQAAAGAARGARHFANRVSASNAGRSYMGALVLESLGMSHGQVPRRIPIGSSPGAVKIEAIVAGAFNDELMVLSPVPWAQNDSDGVALHELGVPTMIVGEIPPAYVTELTEPELMQAARAALRIRRGMADVLIERPTNDAMVTTVPR